jgi:hypothetical protein
MSHIPMDLHCFLLGSICPFIHSFIPHMRLKHFRIFQLLGKTIVWHIADGIQEEDLVFWVVLQCIVSSLHLLEICFFQLWSTVVFSPLFLYTQINLDLGIQLWGTTSTFNIEILERFQSKTLCMIVDAIWYVSKSAIWRDLQIPTVKEEIHRYSSQYRRLSAHPNDQIVNNIELPGNKRLRRHLPNDLQTRFLVWLLYL